MIVGAEEVVDNERFDMRRGPRLELREWLREWIGDLERPSGDIEIERRGSVPGTGDERADSYMSKRDEEGVW